MHRDRAAVIPGRIPIPTIAAGGVARRGAQIRAERMRSRGSRDRRETLRVFPLITTFRDM